MTSLVSRYLAVKTRGSAARRAGRIRVPKAGAACACLGGCGVSRLWVWSNSKAATGSASEGSNAGLWSEGAAHPGGARTGRNRRLARFPRCRRMPLQGVRHPPRPAGSRPGTPRRPGAAHRAPPTPGARGAADRLSRLCRVAGGAPSCARAARCHTTPLHGVIEDLRALFTGHRQDRECKSRLRVQDT